MNLRSKGYGPTLWMDIELLYRTLFRIHSRMLEHPEQFGIPLSLTKKKKRKVEVEEVEELTPIEKAMAPINECRDIEIERKEFLETSLVGLVGVTDNANIERIAIKIGIVYKYLSALNALKDIYYNMSIPKNSTKSQGYISGNSLEQYDLEYKMNILMYGTSIPNMSEYSIRLANYGNLPEHARESIKFRIKDILNDIRETGHAYDREYIPDFQRTIFGAIQDIKSHFRLLEDDIRLYIKVFHKNAKMHSDLEKSKRMRSEWDNIPFDEPSLKEAILNGILHGLPKGEMPLPKKFRLIGKLRTDDGKERIDPTFYADMDYMRQEIDEDKYVTEITVIKRKAVKDFIEDHKQQRRKQQQRQDDYHHNRYGNHNVVNDYMDVKVIAIRQNLDLAKAESERRKAELLSIQ